MIRGAITLLLAYIAAAPLTDKISMNLSQTEWTNLWTYVIWLFSFGIWFGIFCLALLGVSVVLAILDR